MKNNEIISLAVAKRETVNRLVSAALIENKIDDKGPDIEKLRQQIREEELKKLKKKDFQPSRNQI